MKKPDLIKQLANRINQPHVIESWINKIEKAAYNKGFKDAESKQCNIPIVSGSADADYWSERCKHAENIWEKSPCDPDINDEQIEAHNEYHKFIKENGSKHYR